MVSWSGKKTYSADKYFVLRYPENGNKEALTWCDGKLGKEPGDGFLFTENEPAYLVGFDHFYCPTVQEQPQVLEVLFASDGSAGITVRLPQSFQDFAKGCYGE